MHIEALRLGLVWLAVGLVYGTVLHLRGRTALRV
jgi:hypothetical protein